uniref:Solute carrier family 17 member 4 n=1 Tax=Equus asinus asinus TaxID=83772 RepID=A0A8C4L8H6_EQUAS
SFNFYFLCPLVSGFCSVRHGLAFTLYICNFLIYTQKMSMSIAIPAMVNNTVLSSPANEVISLLSAPMYDWSPEIQGIILSSLNYGSFLAPIPIGYVAGIFGAKYLVGVGLFISSVLTLFIPLVTDAGATFLIVLQIVQGIFQVIVNTSQYSIWVKWAPPQERSQLISIAMSGSVLGSFIILLVGGFLCQTVGWPYIFYIFGGIGCACSFLWFPLVYDDPANHPFISTGEREYIVCSLAQQDYSSDLSLPIKAMIKSLPLWSILVSYFSEFWLFNIFVAYIPTYINSVLQVNLRDSGILSALPFLVGSICMILGGLLADFLLSRKILRLVTIRKLFTAMGKDRGVIFPSVLCVSLPWVSSSHITTMAFLVLFTAFSSLSEAGSFVNILDIAPRGLLQVSYHISGAISPTVTGIFLSQDSEFGWRNIFLLSAAINTSGLVFYLIFGQAEVQEWAKEQTITHL